MTYEGDYKGLKRRKPFGGAGGASDTVKYEVKPDEVQPEPVILKEHDPFEKIKNKKVKFKPIAIARERDPRDPDKAKSFFYGIFDLFDCMFSAIGLGDSNKNKADREQRNEMAI